MSAPRPTILWFRADLRLRDNPALDRAVARGGAVMPIFVLDDDAPGRWAAGGAARWWLHHSLSELSRDLRARGARLRLMRGPAERVVTDLARRIGAGAVVWNRLYEPWSEVQDQRIEAALADSNIDVTRFNGRLLVEPWRPKTGANRPYQVFTPYWKAISKLDDPPRPLPAPETIDGFEGPEAPDGDAVEDWRLVPRRPDWAHVLRKTWTPGEAGALARLTAFLEDGLSSYAASRDRPGDAGTSRLSPHLHWGEISPRQVWHATRHRMASQGARAETAGARFLRKLGWREFSYHLLYWFPDMPERSLKQQFEGFPWRNDECDFRAWREGRTGYPIVDAGLHELWATGWMHNRVRMVAASFLVKDLLLPWQWGEAWFWDTLVDADLANNSASWQWVAGCGADAAPYFRIFNPVTQGRRFDPDGRYVREWLPEIAALPDTYLHAPWTAPEHVLAAAGIVLGDTYPHPMVDHHGARQRALAALEAVKLTPRS